MAIADALPYGVRQILLTPYMDAQGTVLSSTSYPLPVAMTLGFSEAEQFDELRGDDKLVAVHGRGPQVDWSLESGGLPIYAWSIIGGGLVIEAGTTPNRTTRLRKSGRDSRPYFRIDGRVISDSGGSITARIYRAKANGKIQANFKYGAFQMSQIDGVGLPLTNDDASWLYEIIRNETDSALSLTPEANPIAVPSNVTVGAITATTVALSWTNIPEAASFQVQQSTDSGVTWTDVTSPHGGAPTTNSTVITTLTTATNYKFQVCTIINSIRGDFSTAVSVLTS